MLRKILCSTVAACAIAACVPAVAAPSIDWPTYGFDSLRWGFNPHETQIDAASVAGLQPIWSFKAGAFDTRISPKSLPSGGVIGGQPIVAANVQAAGGPRDLVLVGDNNGNFFALDANSANPAGSVVWYRRLGAKHVGKPVDRDYGIRGSGVVDRTGTGTVYVASNSQVYALDLATGASLPGWPVSVVGPGAPDTDGQIHDALNLVGNRLYVGTSAVGADQTPFYGRVVSISTTARQVASVWFPMSGSATKPSQSGGGVWSWGGVAVDSSGDRPGGVYAATGNAMDGPQQAAYAENIVNLSADLRTLYGAATPALPTVGDDDYGSTPLVFSPKGCTKKLAIATNKIGKVVVDRVDQDGKLVVVETHTVTTLGGTGFNGTSVFNQGDQQVLLTTSVDGPAPYQHGLMAFRISRDCSPPWLTLAWQTTQQLDGTPIMANGGHISSPVVANGLVYFGAELPSGNGRSRVYAAITHAVGNKQPGTVVWQSPVVAGTFDSAVPTIVNGKLFFSTQSAQPTLYAFGLKSGN